jgi:hypothetical protein
VLAIKGEKRGERVNPATTIRTRTKRMMISLRHGNMVASQLLTMNDGVSAHLQSLIEFDELLMEHDWQYWMHDIKSQMYARGYNQRTVLLDKRKLSNDHNRLFKAWAWHRNAQFCGGDLWDEIQKVRTELGLPNSDV